MVKWTNGEHKYVSSAEAKSKYVQLVIGFLVGKLRAIDLEGRLLIINFSVFEVFLNIHNAIILFLTGPEVYTAFVLPKIEIVRNVSYDMTFFRKFNENQRLVRSQSLYNIPTDINYSIHNDDSDDSASENVDNNQIENNAGANEQNVPEHHPQQNLMVVNRVPFGVRGRKRRHSLYVTNSEREKALDGCEPATNEPNEIMEIGAQLDHFTETDPMEANDNNSNDSSNFENNEWLIDFNEPEPQPQSQMEWNPTNMISGNFNQIMSELEGIDVARPNLRNSLPKGTTAQMIAYRVNQGIDLDININDLIDNAELDFGDLPHFESD